MPDWYFTESKDTKKHQIIFDEDCQELSPVMIKAFKSTARGKNLNVIL